LEELLIAAINPKRVTVPRSISEANKGGKKIKILESTFLIIGSSVSREEVTLSAVGCLRKLQKTV